MLDLHVSQDGGCADILRTEQLLMFVVIGALAPRHTKGRESYECVILKETIELNERVVVIGAHGTRKCPFPAFGYILFELIVQRKS